MKVTIEIDEQTAQRLAALAGDNKQTTKQRVSDTLRYLACSASEGVRRPGSWERSWLTMAFAGDVISEAERNLDQVPPVDY